MNIYTSTRVLPYVYICTHKITGQFYIGYRERNTTPSDVDFPKYQTSCSFVQDNFDQFNWYILAEFFNGDDAYDLEQRLIFKNWNDPLIINQRCMYGKQRFKTRKGVSKSKLHREKLSATKVGIPQGKNPLKGHVGQLNGMYGKRRTLQEKQQIASSRALRTTEQNLASYSRIKTEEEKEKIRQIRKTNRVCRLSDQKEMSTSNFFKYLDKN